MCVAAAFSVLEAKSRTVAARRCSCWVYNMKVGRVGSSVGRIQEQSRHAHPLNCLRPDLETFEASLGARAQRTPKPSQNLTRILCMIKHCLAYSRPPRKISDEPSYLCLKLVQKASASRPGLRAALPLNAHHDFPLLSLALSSFCFLSLSTGHSFLDLRKLTVFHRSGAWGPR